MKIIPTFLLLALTVAACTSRDSLDTEHRGGSTTTPPSSQENASGHRSLAYEHNIAVDLDEAKLKPLYEQVLATCNTDKAIDCTVLNARLTAGAYPSAELRLRTKTEGVQQFVALVSAGGKVSSQSTHVEDLAKPIADVEKRLAMLRDYQAKLLELQGKPTNDIDALLKIVEKLSSVQADLERATGESAHFLTRVNLEILTLSLSTRATLSFWAPIADALSEFPGHLSGAMAAVIVGVAYLFPWLLILLIGGVSIRVVWRWFTKR